MFSHVTVGSNDLDKGAAFYDAVLLPLGLVRRAVTPDGGPAAACWVTPGAALPRFYLYSPFDQQPAHPGNGSMMAFLAPSPEAVDAAHAAGLASGGLDAGAPGPRPQYGDGYYGAYLRDPDGNKLHVVHRGDLQANAMPMAVRTPATYQGSCHCGAVRFEIVTDFPELTTCDCSICRRKNALMVKVHETAFRLLGGEASLTAYQFHTHTATHYFCKVCGIYPFHRKRVTPDFLGVNVHCLEGFSDAGIPVRATVGAGMP